MHTSTFWLKFGSLSPAVTLKIRSRSPKPNQLFIISQCYIYANLVKIHPPVHQISCIKGSVINRICTKNNMSPTPSVGDIIPTDLKSLILFKASSSSIYCICVQTVKALVRPHGCTDLPGPLQFVNVVNAILPSIGTNCDHLMQEFHFLYH